MFTKLQSRTHAQAENRIMAAETENWWKIDTCSVVVSAAFRTDRRTKLRQQCRALHYIQSHGSSM